MNKEKKISLKRHPELACPPKRNEGWDSGSDGSIYQYIDAESSSA